MKFWESSFLLIPSGHPSIKKIVDKEIRQGDIYAEGFANAETMNHLYLIDGFVKIMETANRIKRNAHVASNRIYVSVPASEGYSNFTKCLCCRSLQRKVSTSIPQIASAKDLKSAGRSASTQSLTDELTTTMPMNILSILKNELVANITFKIHKEMDIFVFSKNFFIPKGNRLPELTFVSAEIVHWLMSNVAEINTIEHAIAFCQVNHIIQISSFFCNRPFFEFQQQMDEGRIAHITSQTSFIYGFVLYYFVSSDTKFTEIGSFMEVEVTEYPSCSTEFGIAHEFCRE